MTSTDPTLHQGTERQFFEHVERLLDDDRLRLDTRSGRRPLTVFIRRVTRGDHGVDLKRLMSELDRRDRELQNQMPIGRFLDVELSQKRLWLLKKLVGRLRMLSVPPTRALLENHSVQPLGLDDVTRAMRELPPPLRGEPVTIVLFSSAGFTPEAREFAERSPTNTILAESNEAGGFSLYGPTSLRELKQLLDPEAEQQKRDRVVAAIAERNGDLTGSGIAADHLAIQTQLPIQLVESELKSYARNHAGLTARKLDGRLVLFREGSLAPSAAAGGVSMPMIDRIKSLFGRRGENEKKIAFLSERRTALSQQRYRSYEEISSLETRDADLRQQFKNAGSELAKHRITSQLLQLRKDMERRQQLLGVLNQQINVVSTHLHNLELVQQGQTAQLPDSEEMAEDAAKAEEVLADLEASGELAASVGAIGQTGLSSEEQLLYDELEKENAPVEPVKEPPQGTSIAGADQTPSGKSNLPPIPPIPEHRTGAQKRSEPEPG